jgi:hypothetical protein
MLQSKPVAGEVIARLAIVFAREGPLAHEFVATLTSLAAAAPRL